MVGVDWVFGFRVLGFLLSCPEDVFLASLRRRPLLTRPIRTDPAPGDPPLIVRRTSRPCLATKPAAAGEHAYCFRLWVALRRHCGGQVDSTPRRLIERPGNCSTT